MSMSIGKNMGTLKIKYQPIVAIFTSFPHHPVNIVSQQQSTAITTFTSLAQSILSL